MHKEERLRMAEHRSRRERELEEILREREMRIDTL